MVGKIQHRALEKEPAPEETDERLLLRAQGNPKGKQKTQKSSQTEVGLLIFSYSLLRLT